MLRPQDFSIISIQCPLMTHHPNKSHLCLCKDSFLCGRCIWMDVARRGALEQRPSPWLMLSCSPSGWGWPRSCPPASNPKLALSSWHRPPAGLQAAVLLTLWFFLWHLPGSRKRVMEPLFNSAFPLHPLLLVELWEPKLNFSPISSEISIRQESSLHLRV